MSDPNDAGEYISKKWARCPGCGELYNAPADGRAAAQCCIFCDTEFFCDLLDDGKWRSPPLSIKNEHELKCWPEEFDAIWHGLKTCEIRKTDRDFVVKDVLILVEWDPETETPRGRKLVCEVTHIVPGGRWGLPDGLCVMSIRVMRWAGE